MSGHGDSSLSKRSERSKETGKKVRDHVREVSKAYDRLQNEPSPTNYPHHMEKAKADEYNIAARKSWTSNAVDINQKYREEVKNVEGNSNQEILAKKSELAQNHMDQQVKLEKLQRALRDDLRRRSEGE